VQRGGDDVIARSRDRRGRPGHHLLPDVKLTLMMMMLHPLIMMMLIEIVLFLAC